MSEQITCPVCNCPTSPEPGTEDWKCSQCGRVWYKTGNPEAPVASRRRAVRLTKIPEEGDRLSDVIQDAGLPPMSPAVRKAMETFWAAMIEQLHKKNSVLTAERNALIEMCILPCSAGFEVAAGWALDDVAIVATKEEAVATVRRAAGLDG